MITKRINWIDVLRGIAIIAVVIDHSFSLRTEYSWITVQKHTYFSISWFVFLAGLTSSLSYANIKSKNIRQKISVFYLKRLHILIAYILASLVSGLVFLRGGSDINKLFSGIINFNIDPPFYFMFLIINLYLVFPVLFLISRLSNKAWFPGLSVIFIIVLTRINPYVSLPWRYELENLVAGGIYLPVFYLGVIYSRIGNWVNKYALRAAPVIFIILEYIWIFNIDFLVHKPNYILFAWSLSLLFTAKSIVVSIPLKPVWSILAFCGRSSLYIFLYHFLLLKLTTGLKFHHLYTYYGFIISLVIFIALLKSGMDFLEKYYKKTIFKIS